MGEKSAALSVSAALGLVKSQLESITVKIIGEVSEVSSNPRYKAVYFTVKDEKASLPCMMWTNRYNASGITLSVGQLIEISGRFSLYAAKGRMNFDVFSIELAGEGKLRMQVANLAKSLSAEGLMAPERKKRLPTLPSRIGLVTSPRGAAVYDVLRTLRRRYPMANVVFAGVGVEGKDAPNSIIEGLKTVESAGVDVLLLVRGGGSFEDLMPFNDELLARHIADMEVPVVTGIGHEPDTSIADMVSDYRASTPTAAAEAVVPAITELFSYLDSAGLRLQSAISTMLSNERARLERVSAMPVFKEPARLFDSEAQRLDEAQMRMMFVGKMLTKQYSEKLSLYAAGLNALSPLAVLSRGYAIARSSSGAIINNVGSVFEHDRITVQVADGKIGCEVEYIEDGSVLLEV